MQDMSRKSHKRELFRMVFKMFILKSFDGVSIPDIEKATGFTRGTIFHYADTKLDLFRQVVEYYVLERDDGEPLGHHRQGCAKEGLQPCLSKHDFAGVGAAARCV